MRMTIMKQTESQRQYYLNNKERLSARTKERRSKDINYKEKAKVYYKRYYLKNKGRILIHQKEKRRQNPNYKKEQQVRSKNWYSKSNTKLYTILGNKCSICGCSNVDVLVIHHMNKDKNKFVQSNPTYYFKELELGVPLKLLCANCHLLLHKGKLQIPT